jgi:hypothetical protein
MAYNRALVNNASATFTPTMQLQPLSHHMPYMRNPNGKPKNTACLGSAGHVEEEKRSGELGTGVVD